MNWRPNIQTYERMGTILIKNDRGFFGGIFKRFHLFMTVRGLCMIPVHSHGVHVETTGTELPFHSGHQIYATTFVP